MVLDIHNAFIQTNIPPKKEGEERVIIKLTGVLVDMIVKRGSEEYRKHVIFENKKKFILRFCVVINLCNSCSSAIII